MCRMCDEEAEASGRHAEQLAKEEEWARKYRHRIAELSGKSINDPFITDYPLPAPLDMMDDPVDVADDEVSYWD